jgi:predicted ribosome quality control (RQC) complex YloA/Tae2 family protein
LVACAMLVAGMGQVIAAGAESVFAGKVLVLKKVPPNYFKTKGGFIKFLRANRISTVYESKDHTWSFPTLSFFKRPLGDYEVQVVFYDVTNGSSESKRKFVDAYGQNTMDRNTRSLFHKVRITRPLFDAKKKYEIHMQKGGSTLARGSFSTKGVTQAALDQQKRLEHEMKKMEESMKQLEKLAKEQEEEQKRKQEEENKKAADDLF